MVHDLAKVDAIQCNLSKASTSTTCAVCENQGQINPCELIRALQCLLGYQVTNNARVHPYQSTLVNHSSSALTGMPAERDLRCDPPWKGWTGLLYLLSVEKNSIMFSLCCSICPMIHFNGEFGIISVLNMA